MKKSEFGLMLGALASVKRNRGLTYSIQFFMDVLLFDLIRGISTWRQVGSTSQEPDSSINSFAMTQSDVDCQAHLPEQREKYYTAVYTSALNKALSTIKRLECINFAKFNFYDIGSGKGKALIIADHYNFLRVIGIEIDHQLSVVASLNLSKASARLDHCVVVSSSALTYPLQNIDSIFLINDSLGESDLKYFLSRLGAIDATIYIIYICPRYYWCLENIIYFKDSKNPNLRFLVARMPFGKIS